MAEQGHLDSIISLQKKRRIEDDPSSSSSSVPAVGQKTLDFFMDNQSVHDETYLSPEFLAVFHKHAELTTAQELHLLDQFCASLPKQSYYCQRKVFEVFFDRISWQDAFNPHSIISYHALRKCIDANNIYLFDLILSRAPLVETPEGATPLALHCFFTRQPLFFALLLTRNLSYLKQRFNGRKIVNVMNSHGVYTPDLGFAYIEEDAGGHMLADFKRIVLEEWKPDVSEMDTHPPCYRAYAMFLFIHCLKELPAAAVYASLKTLFRYVNEDVFFGYTTPLDCACYHWHKDCVLCTPKCGTIDDEMRKHM